MILAGTENDLGPQLARRGDADRKNARLPPVTEGISGRAGSRCSFWPTFGFWCSPADTAAMILAGTYLNEFRATARAPR